MSENKKEEVKGFYSENVVLVKINGVDCEVNKYEAKKLEEKLKAKK